MKITQHLAKIPPKHPEFVFITMDFIHGYSRSTLSGSMTYLGVHRYNCKPNDTE